MQKYQARRVKTHCASAHDGIPQIEDLPANSCFFCLTRDQRTVVYERGWLLGSSREDRARVDGRNHLRSIDAPDRVRASMRVHAIRSGDPRSPNTTPKSIRRRRTGDTQEHSSRCGCRELGSGGARVRRLCLSNRSIAREAVCHARTSMRHAPAALGPKESGSAWMFPGYAKDAKIDL